MVMHLNLKSAIAGAFAGGLLTMLLGFTMGGWVTSSKSENTAREESKQAVITALAPICLSNFKESSDAKNQHALLEKTEDWKRADFVQTAGWAKMPGLAEASTGLASTCARLILADK